MMCCLNVLGHVSDTRVFVSDVYGGYKPYFSLRESRPNDQKFIHVGSQFFPALHPFVVTLPFDF